MASIPGLGFLPDDFNSEDKSHCLSEAQTAETLREDAFETVCAPSKPDKVLFQEHSLASSKPPLRNEIPNINDLSEVAYQEGKQDVQAGGLIPENASTSFRENDSSPLEVEHHSNVVDVQGNRAGKVATLDGMQGPQPETAREQQNSQDAEWSFDTSDDDSSDSSSGSETSDESSDDDEVLGDASSADEDYELLDPAEQARILMKDDPDDDSKGPNGAKSAPKTANEQNEETIQRPNVIITNEMRLEELGIVENVIESFVLIKGTVHSETKVLGSGSPLCLEDRTIIGSVAEPVGRVDNPRYSVAFNSVAEMTSMGIGKGCKVFYPLELADYVFTQPLKLMKGSDASNMHDEEVAREEVEFSDDEAEAAYKRQKKLERQTKKGGISALDSQFPNRKEATSLAANNDIPDKVEHMSKYEPAAYDDDLYTPLPRPPTLYGIESAPPPLIPTFGNPFRDTMSHHSKGRSREQNHNRRSQRGKRGSSGRARQDRGNHSVPFHQPIPFNQQPPPTPQYQNAANSFSETMHQSNWSHYSTGSSIFEQPTIAAHASRTSPASITAAYNAEAAISGVPPGAFVNPAFFQQQQGPAQTSQHHQPSQQSSNQSSEVVPIWSHEQTPRIEDNYWHRR